MTVWEFIVAHPWESGLAAVAFLLLLIGQIIMEDQAGLDDSERRK